MRNEPRNHDDVVIPTLATGGKRQPPEYEDLGGLVNNSKIPDKL